MSVTLISKRRQIKYPGSIHSTNNPDIGRTRGILYNSARLKITKKHMI
jgi:hypothetical protein